MRRKRRSPRVIACVACVAAAASCGPPPPEVSRASQASRGELSVVPDRVTLLGAPSGRTFATLFVGEGQASLLTADALEVQSSDPRVAEVVGDRVIARGPGAAILTLRYGEAEATIQVDVLDRPAPFVREVLAFEPGNNAGFGAARYPEIVFGPPEGAGDARGSTDALSLGATGTITVAFGDLAAYDGPGPDLIVFENPFFAAGSGFRFSEPGRVSLSFEDEAWLEIACDPERPIESGCAGVEPVYASPMRREIDPTDPRASGGDAFDLEGLADHVDRLRIVDVGAGMNPPPTAGFDLDAAALAHALPKDASELIASEPRIAIAPGATRLAPRFDAHHRSGDIQGVAVHLTIEGGPVELDGPLLHTRGPGVAQLSARAGALTSTVMIEVME